MSRSGATAFAATFAAILLFGSGAGAGESTTCAANAEQAQSLRERKRLLEAQKLLLQCSSTGCPTFVRQDCLRWHDEVRASLPTIVVRAATADGKDVLTGTVTVDDKPQSLGITLPLNPGPHVVRVSSTFGQGEHRFLAAEGEKNRLIIVSLDGGAARTDADAARSAQPRSEPPAAITAAPPRKTAWPWVLGGVGVAGLASFGVLQLAASAQYDELEQECQRSCELDRVQPVRTMVAASAVALLIGVVALTTGTLVWLSERDPSAPSTQAKRNVLVNGFRF